MQESKAGMGDRFFHPGASTTEDEGPQSPLAYTWEADRPLHLGHHPRVREAVPQPVGLFYSSLIIMYI